MTMQQQVEYITVNELLTNNYMGLATTDEEIQSVLNSAVRENDFYIGTNVKEWLSSFSALILENMIEKFSLLDENGHEFFADSWKNHSLEILMSDNSYNWNGRSNCDIQFYLLQDDAQNCYAYVMIHLGGDVRGGYTKGILLDLDTYSRDCFINFINNLNEYGNNGYITIDGIDYSITGDIMSEYLSVYSYATNESYEICDSVYEFNQNDFDSAVRQVVLNTLEKNENN